VVVVQEQTAEQPLQPVQILWVFCKQPAVADMVPENKVQVAVVPLRLVTADQVAVVVTVAAFLEDQAQPVKDTPAATVCQMVLPLLM
jgi:hypothetical protein